MAYAQTPRTWIGGTVGFESDMATAANWSPSGVPSTSANDPMLFDGSSAFNTITFPGGTFSGNNGVGNITIAGTQTAALSIDNSGAANSVFRLKNVDASPANLTIDASAGAFSMGTGGNSFFLNLTAAATGAGNVFTNNSANAATFGSQVTINASSGINGKPTFAGSGDWLVSGPITNAITKGLTKNGAGKLTLTSSANAYTGGTSINGGIVSFANGALGSSGAITMNGGTLQWNGSNTQDISSRLTLVNATNATLDTNGNAVTLATAFGGGTTGALTKIGSGTLTLGGANTYTGDTTIGGGTISITNANALGSGASAVKFTGGKLNVSLAAPTIANTLSVAAAQSGVLDLTANGAQTFNTGAISIDGTLQLTRDSGTAGQLIYSAAISGSGILELGNTQGGAALSASNQGRAQFTNLNAFTNFTGDIHVLSGGNLALFNATQTTTSQDLTIDTGGYVTILNTTTNFGGLNGGGRVIRNNASGTTGTLVIGNGDADGGFSGIILGNNTTQDLSSLGIIAVTKTGTGTQILSGASTYSGLTTVSAGTLLANNATGSATGTGANGSTAAVTVASTGTLGGTGIINPTGVATTNAVSINGTLAPGDSTAPANATTGNLEIGGRLAFLTGSTYQVQIGGTSIGDGLGTYDQINQTESGGTITLAGTVNLSVSLINSFTPGFSDVFYILNSNGGRTGALFNGIAEGGLISLGGGYTGQVTYSASYNFANPSLSANDGLGNDVAIFNIVPEPGSFAMFLVGSMAMWYMRRKRSV